MLFVRLHLTFPDASAKHHGSDDILPIHCHSLWLGVREAGSHSRRLRHALIGGLLHDVRHFCIRANFLRIEMALVGTACLSVFSSAASLTLLVRPDASILAH